MMGGAVKAWLSLRGRARSSVRRRRRHMSCNGMGGSADKREPMTGRTPDTRSNPRRRKHHGSYDGVGRDADRDTGRREPRPTKRGSDFLKQQRGSLDPTLEWRHREAHPAGEAWGHQDPEYWQCNKMRLRGQRDKRLRAHLPLPGDIRKSTTLTLGDSYLSGLDTGSFMYCILCVTE